MHIKGTHTRFYTTPHDLWLLTPVTKYCCKFRFQHNLHVLAHKATTTCSFFFRRLPFSLLNIILLCASVKPFVESFLVFFCF